MKQQALTVIGLLTIILMGCGSIKTRDKNEASVAQIKKVAVVAFTADLPASREIGLNLNSGKAEGQAGGSLINKTSDSTDQLFREVHQAFAQKLKWQVVEVKNMTANPGYIKAFKKTMEGWQNKMPPGAGSNRFLVHGVMDFDSVRILDVTGREELMRDLGVDAIVATKVDVALNGTTVMGIGNRHPQSTLTFFVYRRGEAQPVWWDGLKGEEVAESVGKTGFIDEKKVGELSIQSARSAFNQLNQKVE